MNQKNVKYLILGKTSADFMAAGSYIHSAADMTGDGYLAIVDEKNYTVSGAKTTGKYRILQRVGDDIVASPYFDAAKLRGKRQSAGVAATEQVTFVGFNGTSGTLGAANSSDYIVAAFIDNVRTNFNNSPSVAHWSMKSSASATDSEVAEGLLESFLAWRERAPEKIIKCERVASGATNTGAAFDTATIAKFTKGSTSVAVYTKAAAGNATITASVDTKVANTIVTVPSTNGRVFTFSASALGAGAGSHVIYIGNTSYVVADAGNDAQNAAAIVTAINAGTQARASAADAVVTITYGEHLVNYLPPMVLSSVDDATFAVVAVTTTVGNATSIKYIVPTATSAAATFDLDHPWQGETGYVYSATIDSAAKFTYLTGDYTIGATPVWGLKFTGEPYEINAEKYNYAKVTFKLGLQGDFGSTALVTYSSAATEGNGTYAQIARLEAQAQLNDGPAYVQAYPSVHRRAEAAEVARRLYPLYQTVIEAYDDNFAPILGGSPKSYATIIVATPNATAHAFLTTLLGL